MHQKLKAFKEVLPFVQEALFDDCAVGLTDREKFVDYRAGEEIDVGAEVGMSVPEDDAIAVAMEKGQTQKTFVPEEVFGMPFVAIGTPIRDEEGNVIGGFGYTVDATEQMEIEDELERMAQELVSALQQTKAGIQQINSNIDDLADDFSQMTKEGKSTKEVLEDIDQILKIIKDISRETNLLGLNASIEATRADEAGGFKVVADEIQDLAARSEESAKEITEYLEQMNDQVEKIITSIERNNSRFQEQKSAMEEITASVEELGGMAENLNEVAEKVANNY